MRIKFRASPNWILLIGQLLAQLSDRMLSIGLIWIISKNFGDTWVTWYLVIGGIPHLLFFALNAKIIQIFGALNVVIASDWIRSIIYGIASMLLTGIAQPSELYQVMAIIFASNSMAAFFNPAIFSLPLEIARGVQIQKLTAKLSAIGSLTSVLGPIAGIFCFQILGLRGLFILASIFYLTSGFCGWLLRSRILKPELVNPETSHIVQEPPAKKNVGISPLIYSMLVVFLLMNLLTIPLQILVPSMARNLFSGSFNALATMEGGLGFGISAGGILLSIFTISKRTLFFTWLFLVGVALTFLAFQYSLNLWLAAILLGLLGLFVGLANILILNIFQSQPRPEFVPQIMSYVNLISSAAVPISLILAGALQATFTISEICKISAYALTSVCLLSWLPFQKWGKELL